MQAHELDAPRLGALKFDVRSYEPEIPPSAIPSWRLAANGGCAAGFDDRFRRLYCVEPPPLTRAMPVNSDTKGQRK
jgi:hypothetical protein